MRLFLSYDDLQKVLNTFQALRILDVKQNSSQEEIKTSYRKKVLEVHPDRIKDKNEDKEFKKITEAYHFLKNNDNQKKEANFQNHTYKKTTNFKKKPQWGATDDQKIPEQDWGKYTREFEEGDPNFWKEYERKFWEDYNARIRSDGKNGEWDKAAEPKTQPNLFVDVDESLCIACCSCETIAPDVFEINRKSMLNPKSSVIDQKGAGINKIMNAAETCPTKAISIDNTDTKKRIFPH